MSRRKHSIIDGFPADLKDAVDEMIKSDFTYREIVNYIKKQAVDPIDCCDRGSSGNCDCDKSRGT